MCYYAVTRSRNIGLPRLELGIRLSLLPNPAKRQRDVLRSVGCIHSSEEVAVMAMERRDAVIQFEYL